MRAEFGYWRFFFWLPKGQSFGFDPVRASEAGGSVWGPLPLHSSIHIAIHSCRIVAPGLDAKRISEPHLRPRIRSARKRGKHGQVAKGEGNDSSTQREFKSTYTFVSQTASIHAPCLPYCLTLTVDLGVGLKGSKRAHPPFPFSLPLLGGEHFKMGYNRPRHDSDTITFRDSFFT